MTKLDTYDIANWRPITHQTYVEELAQASATIDNPNSLVIECVQLPDTRMRLVTLCNVYLGAESEPQSEVRPYLMILANLEDGKTHCFVTTVGHLADE